MRNLREKIIPWFCLRRLVRMDIKSKVINLKNTGMPPPYISPMKRYKEVYVEGTLNLEQLKVLVEYFEEDL